MRGLCVTRMQQTVGQHVRITDTVLALARKCTCERRPRMRRLCRILLLCLHCKRLTGRWAREDVASLWQVKHLLMRLGMKRALFGKHGSCYESMSTEPYGDRDTEKYFLTIFFLLSSLKFDIDKTCVHASLCMRHCVEKNVNITRILWQDNTNMQYFSVSGASETCQTIRRNKRCNLSLLPFSVSSPIPFVLRKI